MGVSTCVQGAFYGAFYNWGVRVARFPKTVFWISLIIAFLLSARFFMSFGPFPLPAELEQDKLWVPQDAPAIDAKAHYDSIFQSSFRRNTIYFTTSPPGGNVLTKEVLKEIRRFDEMVNENVSASTLARPAADFTSTHPEGLHYEDVCAKSTMQFAGNDSDIPNCQLFGHPLELWYIVGGVFDFEYTDAEIAAQVTSGKGIDSSIFPESSNRTINVDATFGGIVRDADGNVVSATAITMTYLLAEAPEGTTARNAAVAWEDQLNLFIDSQWTDGGLSTGSASDGSTWASVTPNPIIEIFPQTSGATSRELGKTIRGDLGALNGAFGIILLYAVYIFARCKPTTSKSCLAFAGCCACGLAITTAFGFTVLLGVKTNPVVNVLPFVLIGIGVDDMFVLLAALEAQPLDLPVTERMGRAMGTAGVSITVTSITDLMAFLLGAASKLPALKGFCMFAAVGIMADFLLQITFFAAWMAMDAYREKKKKIDCCPCCCPTPVEAESGCCCCGCTYGVGKGLAPLGLRPFIKRFYIPLLRTTPCKAFVLLFFTALTAGSAFSATKLKQDFQFRWFVNDDASLQQVFDVQDAYFGNTGLPVFVVTPPSTETDYASVAYQKKMIELGSQVSANSYIESDSVNNWYLQFREWVHDCGVATDGAGNHASCVRRDCTYNVVGGTRKTYPYCTHKKVLTDSEGNDQQEYVTIGSIQRAVDVPGAAEAKYLVGEDGTTTAADGAPIDATFIPPAKFYQWLDQFLADAPLGAIFASEVVWVHNTTDRSPAQVADGVTATRLRANYRSTDQADQQVASMVSLRTDVEAAGFGSTFPYMFMYLYYEQYAIIVQEAITNLALALIAVFVICTLIISNVAAACMVMLCVVLVDVDILGLMYVWGLTIDSVAIVNLVLAIGLAVDYSAHIAHAFMQATGTRQERVDKALEEMGVAVIHGAFSTFLAVVVLSVSKSYIFRVFFKQFFGICVFGALHGLVLLPTLLSLIGPASAAPEAAITNAKVPKSVSAMTSTASAASSVDGVPQVPKSPPTEITVPSPPPSAPGSGRDSSQKRVTPITV